MNTKSMALDYIKRAQECVELSLKAILRSIAIEYPRDHDVGDALETAKE